MVELQSDARGVVVPVRAHAGARRSAILGARNGALRVSVTAAPEKGKANRAIIELLSEVCGVPKSSIELISGHTSPDKRFLIVRGEMDQIHRAVARVMNDEKNQ